MGKFRNYYSYVGEQAEELLDNYMEDFEGELKEGNELDLYEFFDDKVHQWVDDDFIYTDLRDHADIIESSEYVETDSGLWEGLEPVEAVKSQAFFTYRYDLMEAVQEAAKESIEDMSHTVQGEIADYERDNENMRNEIEQLEEELEDLKETLDNYEEGSAEYAEIEDRISETEYAISDLKDEIEGNEEEISNLEDFLDALEGTE